MIDGSRYVKVQLRRAEHLHNARSDEAALQVMYTVFREFSDHGEETAAAYFMPRAYHLMASIHAALHHGAIAEDCFRKSMEKFDQNNFIGRGRVARDYGWWLYNQGHITKGRNQLKAARKLLMQDTGSQTRRQREIAVTDGFLARINRARDPERARQTLLRVDEELRGGDKWIYELDNLKFLIPLLPLASRPLYIARARKIKYRIFFSENLALLGGDIRDGKPLKAFIGFGGRSIKSLF